MNIFSSDYNDLIDDEFIEVPIKNGKEIIYRYLPRLEDILISQNMAVEKSKHTMSASQAGEVRLDKVKVAKAFNGIMAELVCHRFLIKVLGERPEDIKRYDIERRDFKYRRNEEYDIKVIRPDDEYTVEIRSSISYKTTIEEAYENFDIIGTYTNEAKPYENLNDIFIRPIYQFVEVKDRAREELDPISTYLRKLAVDIYIIAGAFKEDFEAHGYVKSMNQGKTQYNAIKIKNIGGVDKFIQRYNSKFSNNQ